MHLLFIHGAPAAGKYTVAKEVAGLTGFELYHNHLVVDEVLKAHPFGSPGFVAERDRLWREYFGRYPDQGRPVIIFTFNPENTVPQSFIDWLFAEMLRRGVRLSSVELRASEAEIERRIGSDQRRQFRKLTDLKLYRQLRDGATFATPLIPRTDLVLDTEFTTPAETANRIVQRFNLV